MTIFAEISPVAFAGPETTDPLAFRWYDKDRTVLGKRMEDHLRWSVCYWHSFAWPGADIFGSGTFDRPWAPGAPVTPERAWAKMDAAFDFFERLGAPFFCFHDVDAMPDAEGIAGWRGKLDETADRLAAKMESTGVRLLWGTANLFSHPRYAAGAATNPDPEVFLWASHQVRSMLEVTHRLGGANYVLWGGREGYDTLLNTDLRRELDQFGRFLAMVVEHAHRIGFGGALLIEPKPHEPTKHQYDRDVSTVYAFLQRYDLEKDIQVNIEANHATLAGSSFEHEIAMAAAYGIFGSIDINRGDPQNGWDTDQFPNNVPDLTLAMVELLKAGGFRTGGFNFDAKVRRQSVDAVDLFHAHVGGVDALARALLAAAKLIEEGDLATFVDQRYAEWSGDLGREVLAGTLARSSDLAVARGADPKPRSGRQEWLENLVARAN